MNTTRVELLSVSRFVSREPTRFLIPGLGPTYVGQVRHAKRFGTRQSLIDDAVATHAKLVFIRKELESQR
jgi:hypothetical protein